MKWFRVYTDIIDDPKISKISLKSYQIFTFLLAFVAENDENGEFILDKKDISWRFRITVNALDKALNELESVNILSIQDGILTILNWNKRQFKSDNINERVKKHRTKIREQDETLHETPPEQNRYRTDTEQIQKQKNKSIDNLSKSNQVKLSAKEKELKLEFENARKLYPGVKRGLDIEFAYLKKIHKKTWRDIIPKLVPAINYRVQVAEMKDQEGDFFPEWAHFKTYIYQSKWTESFGQVKSKYTGW